MKRRTLGALLVAGAVAVGTPVLASQEDTWYPSGGYYTTTSHPTTTGVPTSTTIVTTNPQTVPTSSSTTAPPTTTSTTAATTSSTTSTTPSSSSTTTLPDGHVKVFVCKYEGTPGIDERLQTGQNPISIDWQPGRNPGQYFNDRLVEVIDLLLATPDLELPPQVHLPAINGPVRPERPWVLYEFDDPSLASLAAGQKMMLRLGPANQRRLKARLAEFRRLVATGASAR